MKKSSLGLKIKKMREACGLSQSELARRIEKKPNYISQVEKGVFKPSIETLHDIGEALGVGICDLLEGETKGKWIVINEEFRGYYENLSKILIGSDERATELIKAILDLLSKKQV